MRFPDDVPVLTEGPVTLRAHTGADLEGVYELCTDPLMQEFTPVPSPYTRNDAQEFLARRRAGWESGRSWSFAIEVARGARPARFGGTIDIAPIGSGIGEIGFGAHPAVRGAGVMTAAVQLIVDWGFSQQLRTVVWRANVGNHASRRVAWKTGFTWEGMLRASLPQRGHQMDAWQGTLLATDSREPKTRWLDIPVLRGDRVVLRPVRSDDEARYLETAADPETMLWLGTILQPRDAEAFRAAGPRRQEAASVGAAVNWAVADPADDRYLGSVDLFGMRSLDYKSGEVGYRTHPDARGNGVATAGLRLALGHAFTAENAGGLGLGRVALLAGDGNLASQAVARACGFTQTGQDRRCYDLTDGRVVDLIRFDLLHEEFASAPTNLPDESPHS